MLANLYLHYATDVWLRGNYANCPLERFVDDCIIHCRSLKAATEIKAALERQLKEYGLELNVQKTRIVYRKDSNRREDYENVHFDFLGYTFKLRQAKNTHRNESFTNCLSAVSNKSLSLMREKMRQW